MEIKKIGKNILYFEEINSTNDYLKNNYKNLEEGTIVVANSQTKGRGMRGNTWENHANENLYMSIILKPINVDCSCLTLVIGLCVCKAIKKICNANVKIKWQNDLLLNDKKFCGILTEISEDFLIIGIGININTEIFSIELKNKATSLKLNGFTIDKNKLIEEICAEIENSIEQFKEFGFKYFLNEYKINCVNLGKDVKVINKKIVEYGKILDINDKGQLVFQIENGEIKNILIENVQIRGIDGYI